MSSDRMSIVFAGETLDASAGKSVAAALTDAGHRVFRETITGAPRGMFCGMGVCQDCLVTVDGVPNQRACMTPVRPGMSVEQQAPLANLSDSRPAEPARGRQIAPDVLVLGGGAGGLSAATAAARAGASVVLLDERKVEGGQYFKQTAVAAETLDSQQSEGIALIEAARRAGVEIVRGAEIWGAFDGPVVVADCSGEALIAKPRTLVVATGAYERPVMVPGWTLPGVMTTGAAQTLWRSYRSLAGKRIAICGSGPLNLQVALELAKGGAEVKFVAEGAAPASRNPVAAASMVLAGPRLAARGLATLLALKRLRVPIHHETDLARIETSDDGLTAVFTGPNGDETSVDVDAVCMNAGFEPQNEILRLLGAAMRYDATFGHLRCVRDDTMATSVEHVYAVGDCAGLGGAPAALTEGRIAGIAAAAACGFTSEHARQADLRELHGHRRFQHHLWKLYRIAPKPLDRTADETIICRCEQVTLGELRASVSDQAGHIGTVKRATRLGMGRCQGRYCGPAAVRLLAETTGRPVDDLSHFAPRIPVKPVAIAAIVAAQEAMNAQD